MGRRGRKNKRANLMKKNALERSIELMHLALETYTDDSELANRYVKHAREIAMSAKVRIPNELKRNICHGCKNLLYPGHNMKVKTVHRKGYGSYIKITCLDCGHITRYIFKGKALKNASKNASKNQNEGSNLD